MEQIIGKIIKFILLALLIQFFFIDEAKLKDKNVKSVKKMNLVKKDKEVLEVKGKLIEEGYLNHTSQKFNVNNIYPVILGLSPLKNLKYKKYFNFNIKLDNHIILLNIMDFKLFSSIIVIVYDIKNKISQKYQYNKYLFREFGIKSNENDSNFDFKINDDSDRFDIFYKRNDKNHNLEFEFLEFNLKGNIDLNKENNQESFTINQKISEDSTYFYNKKYDTYKCSGDILLNKTKININTCVIQNTHFRGILEYKSKFIRSTFISQNNKGEIVTFNTETGLGHQESNSVTDYMLNNNKIIPLESIAIKYDPLNFNNGASFITDMKLKKQKQKTDLTFRTHKTEVIKNNYLLLKLNFEIAFGEIEGTITKNNGETLKIKEIGVFYSFMFHM